MQTTIIVLTVGVLVLGLCALFAYVIQAVRDDEIARAYAETGVPMNAAPAPESPSQGQERAPSRGECMRLDCHEPLEVVIHGWGVCRNHDPRAPYDQAITGESVIEAARRITGEATA